MSLPKLSHLQAAVLDALGSREISGRQLRAILKSRNIKKSGPAFYQLMARLEDSEFVEGFYEDKIIEGQRIRERRYRLKGEGVSALQNLQRFYSEKITWEGVPNV